MQRLIEDKSLNIAKILKFLREKGPLCQQLAPETALKCRKCFFVP